MRSGTQRFARWLGDATEDPQWEVEHGGFAVLRQPRRFPDRDRLESFMAELKAFTGGHSVGLRSEEAGAPDELSIDEYLVAGKSRREVLRVSGGGLSMLFTLKEVRLSPSPSSEERGHVAMAIQAVKDHTEPLTRQHLREDNPLVSRLTAHEQDVQSLQERLAGSVARRGALWGAAAGFIVGAVVVLFEHRLFPT